MKDKLEKRQQQKAQERRRNWKRGSIANAVLLGLAVPLSVFGGYREAIASFSPLNLGQEQREEQLEAKEGESLADGSFIQPDTAVASSEYSSSYQATNTIDGSGLSDPRLGSNAIHDLYRAGNHWSTAGTAPRDQLIDWGFNTPQNLNEIYIWNHQSTVGPATNPGYDVTLFDLTLFDAAGNILLTLDDVALQPDTNAAQTFSFGQTVANVSRVRLEIEDVQSSTSYTGLAEVGFNGL